MTADYGDPFPAAVGDGCEPFRIIAEHIGCHEYDVLGAFRGVDVPEWSTPQAIDNMKASAAALNKAAIKTERLIEAFWDLSPQDRELLTEAGCITVQQLRHAAEILRGDSEQVLRESRQHDRAGGRNPAAYEVAEGMRRTFRRLRKSIKFGQDDYGFPSTPFGRAVELAIGEFGIQAHWRGPARVAWEKQVSIEGRLMEIKLRQIPTLQENS